MCFLQQTTVHATNYRCLDDEGKPVLTDSPAQLQNCQPIDLNMKPGMVDPLGQMKLSSPTNLNRRDAIRRPSPVPPPVQPPPPPESSEEAVEEKQPADSELPIAIPLTRIGGSMVVQVLLNGTQSAHLIVDTGATMTVLSYDIGVELGLLSGSGVDLSTVNTAGGSVQVSMTKVDQIEVGQARAENVQVAIHDLPDGISGVSGLLGMSFLKHFTVTLDSNRGFLYLTPRKS